jgi:DNA polymerase III subunit alpha
VEITPELRRRLDELLGPGNAQPIGAPPKPTSNGNGRGRRQFGR